MLAHRKFHADIADHVRLPYKKWWLEQQDPYVLAKNPSLADAAE